MRISASEFVNRICSDSEYLNSPSQKSSPLSMHLYVELSPHLRYPRLIILPSGTKDLIWYPPKSMEQLTVGGCLKEPRRHKGHRQPGTEAELCCHQHLPGGTSMDHLELPPGWSAQSTAPHLCVPHELGAGAGVLLVQVNWSRRWEEGAIGKAETNYTSSDESHLDCSRAKTLPRWLPVSMY